MVAVVSLHPTPHAPTIKIGVKRRINALFVPRMTCRQGSVIPAKTALLNVPTATETVSTHHSPHKSSFRA